MQRNTLLALGGCFVAVIILLFFLKPILSKHISGLPEGWKYQESAVCRIRVPLPPKEKPYLGNSGEYWNFTEQNGNQSGLFNTTAIAIFKNPAEKTSPLTAAVVISCANNTGNDSPKSLIEKYQEFLNFQNKNAVEGAKVTVNILRQEKIWGKDALVVKFSGGGFNDKEEFYVVTDSKIVYLISNVQETTDSFLKQTADTIFSHLSFQ